MSEIKKEKLESKVTDLSQFEIPEDVLDAVSGGAWYMASSVATSPAWDNAFNNGAWVVWREPGCGDHWCQVNGYVYSGNSYISFDLSCPSEGFTATGVPAEQVLFDCI